MFFLHPVPKSAGESFIPRLVMTKEAWNCMPHSQVEGPENYPIKNKYGFWIAAHAKCVATMPSVFYCSH